ncbi:hypothetical protein E5288_WYG017768 [Bos mutus]|uniref:Uncharacterized protein n=1 Tax=Bos mutus TaxID=72004 RepID=A0A6B0RCD7_9CETA|nr:hypothetical protein [Bos mutus]
MKTSCSCGICFSINRKGEVVSVQVHCGRSHPSPPLFQGRLSHSPAHNFQTSFGSISYICHKEMVFLTLYLQGFNTR